MPSSFQPPDAVLTGDPAFFRRGARVRVHGFQVDPSQSVSLDALYSVRELGKKIPYFAWTSGGNSVAFNVPVDVQGTVDLEIGRRIGKGETAVIERGLISFSALSGRDSYKLNPGTYALALRNPGDAVPDWRSIRIGETGLVVDNLGKSSPVGFHYLLLTFDFQTAA